MRHCEALWGTVSQSVRHCGGSYVGRKLEITNALSHVPHSDVTKPGCQFGWGSFTWPPQYFRASKCCNHKTMRIAQFAEFAQNVKLYLSKLHSSCLFCVFASFQCFIFPWGTLSVFFIAHFLLTIGISCFRGYSSIT